MASNDVDRAASDEDDQGVQSDLTDLSFQEVQELRNNIGIKQFNKKYGKNKATSRHPTLETKKKRIKNASPMEVSSKRPVSSASTLSKKSAVSRDPRFDDLSGNYDEQLFKRSYKFIDRMKTKEMKAVKRIAEDEDMDNETRKRAKNMLSRLTQRKSAKENKAATSRVERALKEERKEAIKEGQKPFFLRASEKNKLVLAEKYKELREKGQLDAFMKKKRKQNAKKDGIALPKRSARQSS